MLAVLYRQKCTEGRGVQLRSLILYTLLALLTTSTLDSKKISPRRSKLCIV